MSKQPSLLACAATLWPATALLCPARPRLYGEMVRDASLTVCRCLTVSAAWDHNWGARLSPVSRVLIGPNDTVKVASTFDGRIASF